MPKIIENLREQLLSEAKRQIFERGYSKTTIRSVAGACGVGVGTVYNYFESKEMLVATFVWEEWKMCLEEMSLLDFHEPKRFFAEIYAVLGRFAASNDKLFSDADAVKIAASADSSRHKLLRSQIAAFILPLCEARELDNPNFVSEFISESIICWSMEKADFETVYPLIEKIILKK